MAHYLKTIAATIILTVGISGLSTHASAQSLQFDPAVGGCVPMSSGTKCFTFKGNKRMVSLEEYRKAVGNKGNSKTSSKTKSTTKSKSKSKISNIIKKYSNMKWDR